MSNFTSMVRQGTKLFTCNLNLFHLHSKRISKEIIKGVIFFFMYKYITEYMKCILCQKRNYDYDELLSI